MAEHGLWYPPDPASAPWSTIGGNVATNAGGLCCLKYGVTRDYVLGLEAVVGGPAGAYGTARAARSPDHQGRQRLRPGRAVHRLGGHARRDHRDHPAAAAGPAGAAADGGRRLRQRGRRRRGGGSAAPGWVCCRPRWSCSTGPACRPSRSWKHLGLAGRRGGAAAGPDRHPGLGRATTRPTRAGRASAAPAPPGRSSPPTRARRRRCSPPAASPIRRWNGSARC